MKGLSERRKIVGLILMLPQLYLPLPTLYSHITASENGLKRTKLGTSKNEAKHSSLPRKSFLVVYGFCCCTGNVFPM